jgi:hypothetical protein
VADDSEHQLSVSAVYQHVNRPLSQLGAINQFESASSSVYQGMTVSLHKRMAGGMYFRQAYTWAHAIDSGQDALVAGAPATVQNSYSTQSERASSVTDQRQRLRISAIKEPNPFEAGQKVLAAMFNHWKISGIMTYAQRAPNERDGVGRSESGQEHEQ